MTIFEACKQKNLTIKDLNHIFGIPISTLRNWKYSSQKCPLWCEALIVEKILSYPFVKPFNNNSSFLEALEHTGLEITFISENTNIPYSSLYSWKKEIRKPVKWVEKLVVEKIYNLAFLEKRNHIEKAVQK